MNSTNLTNFKKELFEALKMEGYDFCEVEPLKANSEKTEGISIRSKILSTVGDSDLAYAPVFYYKDLLYLYDKTGMSGVLEKIKNRLTIPAINPEEEIFSLEYLLKNVTKKVINTEINEDFLKTVPHYDVCDLSVIYIVMLPLADKNNIDGIANYTVTYKILSFFGITEAEVEAAAERNMEEALNFNYFQLKEIGARCLETMVLLMGLTEGRTEEETKKNAEELLEALMGLPKDALEMAKEGMFPDDLNEVVLGYYDDALFLLKNGGAKNYLEPPKKPLDTDRTMKMYVLSNKDGYNGFASIMCRKVLITVACLFGRADLFVIPASAHEALIVPSWDGEPVIDKENIKESILQVNANAVADSEFISDNLYMFDYKTLTMSIVE